MPEGDQLLTKKGDQLILAKTSFPADDRSLGYERGADISKEWLSAVTRASLDVAEQVDSILGHISGIKSNDDPKKSEKLLSLAIRILERAYRRPLTEKEKEQSINLIFADLAVTFKIKVKLGLIPFKINLWIWSMNDLLIFFP